jgi:hypothetical protein
LVKGNEKTFRLLQSGRHTPLLDLNGTEVHAGFRLYLRPFLSLPAFETLSPSKLATATVEQDVTAMLPKTFISLINLE